MNEVEKGYLLLKEHKFSIFMIGTLSWYNSKKISCTDQHLNWCPWIQIEPSLFLLSFHMIAKICDCYSILLIISLNCFLFAEHVYCTETRPYNQGARLTAYELVHDKIPSTLICDSAVAALMKTRSITAVIVGADRVAANGDTANKIGTYQVSRS